MKDFVYLHGFASSAQSSKAGFFKTQLQRLGYELHVPDLNAGDFSHLTMTAMVQQARQAVEECSADRVSVLASSLGAMVAVNMLTHGDNQPAKLDTMFLMAPCFDFLSVLRAQLGEQSLLQWQAHGQRSFYHYGLQREIPLAFAFVEDISVFDSYGVVVPNKVRIVHGLKDKIVPVEQSRRFVSGNTQSSLLEVDSDHELLDQLPLLWREFCGLVNL